MFPEQFSGFILLSLVFILMPGPNVLVIIATSLSAGRTRGLQTVAGISLAMALQLLIAALSTSSLLFVMQDGLVLIKWLGVVYLLYLAARSFYRYRHPTDVIKLSTAGSLQRGFWVSLTNPKTIFFFSAFLPQFVSSAENYFFQISLLSVCFWLLAVVCDSCYAVLAANLNWLIDTKTPRAIRLQNGLSGALYFAAGGFLALSHNS